MGKATAKRAVSLAGWAATGLLGGMLCAACSAGMLDVSEQGPGTSKPADDGPGVVGGVDPGPGPTGGGAPQWPANCPASRITPPSGQGCTGACADCECTSFKFTCGKECYGTGTPCLINSGS